MEAGWRSFIGKAERVRTFRTRHGPHQLRPGDCAQLIHEEQVHKHPTSDEGAQIEKCLLGKLRAFGHRQLLMSPKAKGVSRRAPSATRAQPE